MDFILTNDGAAVMTEAASGKDLVLTRAESGTGYSSAPATLSAVSGKQQDLDIEEVTFENQETRITVFLSNRLLENGYNLRQIGIYGKIAGSDQDVLMIVGQQYSGEPIHPIADGEEECRYNVLMKVSGTSSITVEGGSGSLATKRELLLHTENKKNPHNVTAEQVGLGNVPNVKTDDQTPTVEMASDRVNVAEKDTFKIIVGKMMKWFADLKTGAFSSVANNLLTTLAGSVLDARQGKVLKENIDAVDTKVTELSTNLESIKNLSTSEKKIGTWINGKQLYEKTVFIPSYSGNSQFVSHGISDVDIIWIDCGNSFAYSNNGSYMQTFNVGIDSDSTADLISNYLFFAQSVSKTAINIRRGSRMYNIEGYCTLKYTKTTD